MTYYELSIAEYLKPFLESEDLVQKRKAICDIATQMIECLEEFHKTKKVHRDVKPDNFRVHDRKVYLIDFGNIFDYIKEGAHIANTTGYAFKGTLTFASITSHKRNTHSRRDDLEGVAYSILSILSGGSMPWEKINYDATVISKK